MDKIKLMGVLNITPDSFSDGGKFLGFSNAVDHALRMEKEGADLIDIGGESTRPGSEPVSEEEELRRVIEVIRTLKGQLRIPISIDTMKPAVAQAALEAGASFLNDVTGFRNPAMIEIAATYKVDICCAHMLGEPKTMQNNPYYEGGIVNHLLRWADERITILLKSGVERQHIILDPGIGLGKTVADNLEILHNLRRLRNMGFPLLIGASRKSFLTKILNKPPLELGAATIAVHTTAILGGADYIRAHDVAEHSDAIKVLSSIMEANIITK